VVSVTRHNSHGSHPRRRRWGPQCGQKLRQHSDHGRLLEQALLHRPRSVAVEVGFEPTEDLRLHTLSSTAHHRSPPSVSVRDQRGQAAAVASERPRTG